MQKGNGAVKEAGSLSPRAAGAVIFGVPWHEATGTPTARPRYLVHVFGTTVTHLWLVLVVVLVLDCLDQRSVLENEGRGREYVTILMSEST